MPIEDRRASFEISVGNERCSDDYLRAQLEWAIDKFSLFEFSVGDTLQVHNYVALGHPIRGVLDREEAHKIAKEEGDTWLEKNVPTIDEVLQGRTFELNRWDDWLSKEQVQGNLNALREMIVAYPKLESAILADASSYLSRRGKSLEDLAAGMIDELTAYVLEELAVFQYQAENPIVNVYPGSDLSVFRHLAQSDLLPPSLKNRDFVLLEIR